MALITPPPGAIEELPSHRTEFSKTFRMPDEQFKFIARRRRVHVPGDVAMYTKGGFPDWQDADLNWVLGPDGYYVPNAWYTCVVEIGRIAYQYTSKLEGRVEIELARIDRTAVAALPLNFAPVVTGDKITFPRLLPDLDLEFIARTEGLYVNKILYSDSSPRNFIWHIEKSKDCPLKVNCATQGHDNHSEKAAGRVGAKKGDKCRKIEMQHDVRDVTPNKLQEAQDFEETWTGRTFYHDAERRLQPEDAKEYPVWIDQDIIQPITATIDDGYDSATLPNWYYNLPSNFVGYYSSATYYGGWRFPLGVPQGSTITLAEIVLNCNNVINGGNTLDFYGYNVDDAPVFDNTIRPHNIVTLTTASVTSVFNSTGVQNFPITSIVQEVVNRAGWVIGNHISILQKNVVTTGGTYACYIEDYSNPGTDEPILEVTFSSPAVTNIIPRTMPAGWLRRF